MPSRFEGEACPPAISHDTPCFIARDPGSGCGTEWILARVGANARTRGTEFNVDLRGPKVTVSVLDGAVGVAAAEQIRSPGLLQAMGQAHEPEATASMAALSKGQAVEFRKKDGRMQERKADLQRINAWRTRRLEFSNTPLPEAIAEVNRYSSTHVVVGSPELAEVLVVFKLAHDESWRLAGHGPP